MSLPASVNIFLNDDRAPASTYDDEDDASCHQEEEIVIKANKRKTTNSAKVESVGDEIERDDEIEGEIYDIDVEENDDDDDEGEEEEEEEEEDELIANLEIEKRIRDILGLDMGFGEDDEEDDDVDVDDEEDDEDDDDDDDDEETTKNVINPTVVVPETPDDDDDERPARDDDERRRANLLTELSDSWLLSLSSAAQLTVRMLDKQESVKRVSAEKTYSVREGFVKTRIEIDVICPGHEVTSFAS